MYLQGHHSAVWLRLITAPESAKRQAAQDLVELVSRAVFVDEAAQNWTGSNMLPTQPFRLQGRDYDAISLGRDIDIDTIEYLNYDYDGLELFLLRPDDPKKELVPLAARRMYKGVHDHLLLDTSRLDASFLEEIHGRLLQVVPATYSKEHRDLRIQIQREAAEQQSVS